MRQTISLRGQGHAGTNGGKRGNLLVTVYVKEDPRFVREGTSILVEMPINFVQAALGGEIEVPTLDGTARMTIPEGTQTGSTFTLRGKGIAQLGGGNRGDQFVTVNVVTPKNLNQEQKDLLIQFGKSIGILEGFNEKKEKEGFFGKKNRRK